MIDESKVCSKCLKTKPVTEFYHHRARNGYMSSCKMCTLANAKKWRTRKATHLRNAQNEKRKRHPAKHREEQHAYMARIYADPEKHRKNLERHRELVCRTRQYLPDSKVMKARREREADGYVTPRRIKKLGGVIAKVTPVVHFTAEQLPE